MIMFDAAGAIISPAMARMFMAHLERALGFEIDNLDLWAEMHPDQNVQWENCGVSIQRLSAPDDPHKIPPKTFMGFPLELNPHLSPEVILIRKNRAIVAELARLGLTKWDMEGACQKTAQ